jgi:hypothetical protein
MKKIVLLLFISFVFVCLGILILLRHQNLDQFEMGLANIILFGFALIVFLILLQKEIRLRKETKLEIKNIEIIAGVRFYQDQRPHYFGFFYVLISAVIFLSLSKRIGFLQISFFILGIISLSLIVALYFKLILQNYIIFQFDGIQFGKRNFYYVLRWDNIQYFTTGKLHSNPMIFLEALNPEDCIRYLFIQKGKREKIIGQIFTNFSNNRMATGNSIILNSELYRLSTYFSFKILEKYVNHPELRGELNPKSELN